MSAAIAIWTEPPAIGPGMSENFKSTLLMAFSKLMRPLVRILLRNGVAYGEFTEVVKRVYVDVSASSIRAGGGVASESKVAIKTGLSRTEVARLLAAPSVDGDALEVLDTTGRGLVFGSVVRSQQHDPRRRSPGAEAARE